jgi:hypothetical protein
MAKLSGVVMVTASLAAISAGVVACLENIRIKEEFRRKEPQKENYHPQTYGSRVMLHRSFFPFRFGGLTGGVAAFS